MDEFRAFMHRPVVIRALEELEACSNKSGCYFAPADTPNKILGVHQSMGTVSKLIQIPYAIACLQIADQEPAKAWKSLILALRLNNMFKADPGSMGICMRKFGLSRFQNILPNLCRIAAPTREQVEQLDKLLTTYDDQTSLIQKIMDTDRLDIDWYFVQYSDFMCKRAIQLSFYGLIDLNNEDLAHDRYALICLKTYLGSALRAISPVLRPLVYYDWSVYLNNMREITSKEGQPYWTIGDDHVLLERLNKQTPAYCLLTKTSLPGPLNATFTTMIAQSRITRVGLAALLYRQEQGKYPENLAAIHMEKLVDPFSGQALIYRAETHGFIIYSVGPNMRDDGGEATGRHEKDDVAWRFVEGGTR